MNRSKKLLDLIGEQKSGKEVDYEKERESLHKQILKLQASLRETDNPEEQEKIKDRLSKLSFEFNRMTI